MEQEFDQALVVGEGKPSLGAVVVLLSQQVANQAELLAEALGEPYGTLVLTGSVIVIELALIGSTMITGEQNPTLARDSMFSVLMIALTGITGLCMAITSRQSRQKLESDEAMSEEDLSGPNMAGSMVFYNLISTMSVLVLIIPNFSTDSPEGEFSLPIEPGLTDGEAFVVVTAKPSDWVATTDTIVALTLPGAGPVDLGFYKLGSITGVVTQTGREQGLVEPAKDATAFIDLDQDGELDAAEPTATVNEEGKYTFKVTA